jgi:hypothetical protein
MLRPPRCVQAAEAVSTCRYGVRRPVIEEMRPWPDYAT